MNGNSKNNALQIGNAYGWTGGRKGSDAAERTDDLLMIGVREMEAQEPGPNMLIGDINGDLENFSAIQDLIKEHGWIDIGSSPHLREGKPNEPTCNVRTDAAETRRDYILVNPELLDAVQGYRVLIEDTFPTHQPIQISLDITKLKFEKRILRKPVSAAEAFEEDIANKIAEKPELKENNVRTEEKAKLHQAMDGEIEKTKAQIGIRQKCQKYRPALGLNHGSNGTRLRHPLQA